MLISVVGSGDAGRLEAQGVGYQFPTARTPIGRTSPAVIRQRAPQTIARALRCHVRSLTTQRCIICLLVGDLVTCPCAREAIQHIYIASRPWRIVLATRRPAAWFARRSSPRNVGNPTVLHPASAIHSICMTLIKLHKSVTVGGHSMNAVHQQQSATPAKWSSVKRSFVYSG